MNVLVLGILVRGMYWYKLKDSAKNVLVYRILVQPVPAYGGCQYEPGLVVKPHGGRLLLLAAARRAPLFLPTHGTSTMAFLTGNEHHGAPGEERAKPRSLQTTSVYIRDLVTYLVALLPAL